MFGGTFTVTFDQCLQCGPTLQTALGVLLDFLLFFLSATKMNSSYSIVCTAYTDMRDIS